MRVIVKEALFFKEPPKATFCSAMKIMVCVDASDESEGKTHP
jgi:hypothetical protein